MTNYPKLKDMTKKDWLTLINNGVTKGLVKVIDSDKLDKEYGTQGIVCNIGDNAFYCFEKADDYDNALEQFMKDFSQEEINKQIVDQLIVMQEEYTTNFENNGDKEIYGEFEPEYSYYYYYLVDNM